MMPFVAAIALALGFAVFEDDKTDKSKHDATITGCLASDSSQPGQFVITEEGTSRRITVSGYSDLAKHVNHKIKVTGKHDPQKADHMTVAKVEHLSDSCTAQ